MKYSCKYGAFLALSPKGSLPTPGRNGQKNLHDGNDARPPLGGSVGKEKKCSGCRREPSLIRAQQLKAHSGVLDCGGRKRSKALAVKSDARI